MGDSADVVDYLDKFLELVEPLLDKHRLDRVERDILFWYGFHPKDRTMLLCCLSSSRYQSAGTYFSLKQVFRTAHDIFSQRPRDLQKELQDALEQGPRQRRVHNYRRDMKHGPSLSEHRAREVVQELKDEVRRRKKLAREEEDRELEDMVYTLQGYAPYEEQYAMLYARCIHHFPEVIDSLPKPIYVPNAQPPSTLFTPRNQSPPPSPPVQQPRPQPAKPTVPSPHHPSMQHQQDDMLLVVLA